MKKLAIIGAAGMVGREILNYSLQDKTFNEIVTIDRNKEKMEAEVFDTLDSFPSQALCFETKLTNGDYTNLADADVIVVSASIPSPKNLTDRNVLLEQNALLMKDIAQSITAYNTKALYIIVSNPAEAMAYAFLKSCEGKVLKHQVISSGTLLESSRLRVLISEHFNISVNSIFAPVYGEHGSNILIPWSLVNVEGLKLKELAKAKNIKCLDAEYAYKYIRERAFNIVGKRGFTDHGIARAVCRIMFAALANKETIIPSVGVCVNNYNGFEDLYINLPAIIAKDGVRHSFLPTLTEEEREALDTIAKNLYKNQELVNKALA